jgi:hypothetical protein
MLVRLVLLLLVFPSNCLVSAWLILLWRESTVRKPCCASNTAYPTACLRISNGGKGHLIAHNVAFLWMNDWMTNTTNNRASYLVGSDNGISYVGNAAGRSPLQAGTLVIFLTRASQEQTRFVKLAASLRAGGNRNQRTKINLIVYLFRALYIYIFNFNKLHIWEQVYFVLLLLFHSVFFYMFRLYLATFRENSITKEIVCWCNTYHNQVYRIYVWNYNKILLCQLIKTQIKVKVKVQQSRNRRGVAQRVPGDLGSQISMTFGTWRWWGQPHAPAAFTPRKCSWYSFSLGAESTPGPWYGRKEYVTEKSSDTTGNRFRDLPNSSAAP